MQGRIDDRILNIITATAVLIIAIYILINSVGIVTVADIKKSTGDYVYKEYERKIMDIICASNPVLLCASGRTMDMAENVVSTMPLQYYFKENIPSEDMEDYYSYESEWEWNPEVYYKETQANSTTAKEVSIVSTGNVYSKKQLSDFDYIVSKLFVVSGTTYLSKGDFDVYELSKKDMTLKQTDSEKPQILIYHTHSQEGFVDTVEGDVNTTIVGVGEYLTKILEEEYGYNVIHDKGTYDIIDGKLDRSAAYDYARDSISKILEANPSIEVVLDVHRDGVKEGVRLVTEINGKQTAQIMFFNGISRIKDVGDIEALYNPYLEENLAFSIQMRLKSLEYYPDFVRTNYLNAYKYNLDMREKAMLVEVGAQTNTFEEAKNAMEPFAFLLDKQLKQ